ncbi:MAG: peptide chain release factor 2 [Polyangiales bacterium]
MRAAQRLRTLLSASRRWGGIFDVAGLQHEVDRLTNLSAQEGFWDDPKEAEKLMRKRAQSDNVVKNFTRLESDVRGLLELMDMAEGDEESLGELMEQIPELVDGVRALELKRMLTDDDDHNCILSINSGAGGSDAQDWAEMLLRMFTRWCNKKGFKTELLERNEGDVAGIASASMLVKGEYAYGFLRAEHGVHRLVRISKFSGRRETSFVGVNVVPDLDDTIEIEVRPEDLEITTMRSGGAGGQHVNRTESAVRIKHLPTGYVVRCEQERSQHQNRDQAMKMVRGFLYEKERRDREAAFEDAFMSNMGSISFGSSMRSYTIHPSQMVKDERTKHKVTNADAVLDGDLDSFIETYLMMSADKREEDKKKKEAGK